jgi:hypothetical protein
MNHEKNTKEKFIDEEKEREKYYLSPKKEFFLLQTVTEFVSSIQWLRMKKQK